ncbi:MAG: hypothetical protein F4057_09690 [Acidobacteria bacterium]|nr:hypothetical protein [Acidobacteriota bacterium]MYI75561.1 hypothetical protein [Acidobacteriota bacterium]
MPTRKALSIAAGWACLLAAAWLAGRPALPPLVAWWCAVLHLGPRAMRRLGSFPRSALLTCGLSILALQSLAISGALDWLAPPPDPAATARVERLRDVARSIARNLKTAEAAWKNSGGRAAAAGAANEGGEEAAGGAP